jgi:uncharacterized membrane protein
MEKSNNKTPEKNYFETVKRGIKTRFIAGLLVTIPVLITLYIINFINDRFLPLVEKVTYLEKLILKYPALQNIIGIIVGTTLALAIIYIVGIIATNFLGKKIISLGEKIINKIPLIKTVYSLSKQVIESITISSQKSFKRVVWIDFPQKGTKLLGFITKEVIENKTGRKYVAVFSPTTPNPTTGFMFLLPEEEVIESDISIEDAMKSIISGGILLPGNFTLSEPKGSSSKNKMYIEL